MERKLNLKILTSILIVLLFIVFFHINSYAIELDHYSDIETFVNNSSFYQNLYSQYDNIVLMYSGINGQSIRYNYLFSNNNELTLTSNENISNNTFDIYVTGFDYNWYVYYYMTSGRVFSNDFNSGMPIAINIPYEDSFVSSVNQDFITIKGSPVITYNGSPISSGDSFDFSFVINNHTFDFIMEDFTFSNGVTLTSDTLKEGQFVASLYSFNCNNYGNDFINYWASGYIDYFPYSDVDPKKQFYFSTGYETLKLYNGLNDNDVFYRFYFKGYSNDSSVANFDNNIITSGANNYSQWNKYSPVKDSTFLYSNHDIYWATDTSLYGFNGFTNNLWYNESLDSVTVKNTNENIIESDDPEQDSNVYALNNNVYNSSSTSPVITNSNLYGFTGSSYGDLETYSKTEEFTGANTQGVDTSNWTVLDYVKHIPQAISDLPLNFIKGAINLIIPSSEDLKECFDFFNEFAEERLGILYAPISFITDFLENLSDKYTSSFSVYNFTIPRNSLV